MAAALRAGTLPAMNDHEARALLARQGGEGEVFTEHHALHVWRRDYVNGRPVLLCFSCPSWAVLDGDGYGWAEIPAEEN